MEGNKTNDKSDQKIQKKSEKDRNGIIGGLVFGMILLFATYQILAKHSDDIKVAGCWAHARRKFAVLIKSVRKGVALTPAQKVAVEAVQRIDAMCHLDNSYKGSRPFQVLCKRLKLI